MKPDCIQKAKAMLAAITPGKWYWRYGVHTNDRKSSDAGGLHTKPAYLLNGKKNDNVVFPVGMLQGDPYWLSRIEGEIVHAMNKKRPPPLTIALDFAGRQEDLDFIAAAPTLIADLIAECEKLKEQLNAQNDRIV